MFAVGWGANQFAPMLITHREEQDLAGGLLAAIFGLYAVGLIPGLLLGGPASDRRGRRRLVVPAMALSPLATGLLVLGSQAPAALAAGRLLAGAVSGAVFAAATAWVRELSTDADARSGAAARRAAIAMSTGFGAGPLVAGLLAELGPAPLLTPYLPHLILCGVALAALLPVPETVNTDSAPPTAVSKRLRLPSAARQPAFAYVVLPAAPWVFASATIAFAVLPAMIEQTSAGVAGAISALTLGAGVVVQRAASRNNAIGRPGAALLASVAGLLVSAGAVAADSIVLLVVAALILGAAYGLGLIQGLRRTEQLADAHQRAALIGVFYASTYVGFAAPVLLSVVASATSNEIALCLAAALAASCAALVRKQASS